jgi:hypothetical protein
MIRTLFFAAIAVLFAAPAYAASIGHYPHVFVDDGCTDSFNAPATRATALLALVLQPAIQTSGAADIGCDHDPRIRETAIVADTTFGPFKMPPGKTGIVVFADSNVVSNNTDTWVIEILRARPVDMMAVVAATSSALATEADHSVGFHPLLQHAVSMPAGAAHEEVDAVIPATFYIRLNINTGVDGTGGTATSWDGTLSWVAF